MPLPDNGTTIIAPVKEADALVRRWRERHDWSAALGVPAHITVMGPFLAPDELSPEVRARLRALLGSISPIRFALSAVRRLPGLVYLAPEPVAPFERLTRLIEDAWPNVPRYGSAHARVVYHLTVAREEGLAREIESELAPRLPVEAAVDEALLLASAGGWVRAVDRFLLGSQ